MLCCQMPDIFDSIAVFHVTSFVSSSEYTGTFARFYMICCFLHFSNSFRSFQLISVFQLLDIIRNSFFVALCSFESPEECSALYRGGHGRDKDSQTDCRRRPG